VTVLMLAVVSEAASAEEGKPGGKGRPTPKRDEARKKRRAATPTNRKEAAALRRQRLREQRAAQRQALVTGDERNLPARDAGPAKRLARDIVDSRFSIGQVFFGIVLLVLLLSFIPNRSVGAVVNAAMLLLFVAVVVDAVRLGRRARREVEEKYGDKDATGITGYAAMRALQPRRLRRPPPRVSRGEGARSGRA
jgi:Protein of unknown function (DUF3043)